MLGLVARYLDLVAHHSDGERQIRVPSAHLLTDALLYPSSVPIEIRFEADGDYHETRKDGLRLLDDLVGGSEEQDEEARASLPLFLCVLRLSPWQLVLTLRPRQSRRRSTATATSSRRSSASPRTVAGRSYFNSYRLQPFTASPRPLSSST